MSRIAFAILAGWATSACAQNCYLQTIAGPPTFYGGDGGLATSAYFRDITGFRWDQSGNLFIADTGNHRVREVTPDGIVRTIAGTGSAAFSGDGGPALDAALNTPVAVTPDNQGNLFIVDQGNNRVRRIDSSGTITTVAGSGIANYGGDGGLATSAELQHPADAVLDSSGNLYISDTWNFRVRMVTAEGIISTVAGSGTYPFLQAGPDGVAANAYQLQTPAGLALSANGTLYIADTTANRVFAVDSEGIIHYFAGNGTYGDAQSNSQAISTPVGLPSGLSLDLAGNLAIQATALLEVTPSGTLTIASSYTLNAIAFDGNNLYYSSFGNIWPVEPTVSPLAGAPVLGNSGDGGPATQALFSYPSFIAVDASSNVYIADPNSYEIRKVAPNGIISHVAGTGQGGYSGDGGPAASAPIGYLSAIAVDPAGNLYLIDILSNIRKIDTSGIISTIPLSNLYPSPTALKVDSQGNIYVQTASNVEMYRPAVTTTNWYRQYQNVSMFTLDAADNLYTLGYLSGVTTITEYPSSGPVTIATLPQIPPQQVSGAMAVDANGDIFVAWNGLVQEITPDAHIATVGRFSASLPYADGSPLLVDLGFPTDVSLDPAGNLFLAEPYYAAVRELTSGCVVPAQPLIAFDGAVNAGSYQRNDLAPGEIIAIFGENLGPPTGAAAPISEGSFPLTYAGITVTVNGYAAPLLYVSATQVNAVVPLETAGQYNPVLQVTVNGLTSDPYSRFRADASPGVFAIANPDGSTNSASQGASAGSYITIYGTGQGLSNPPEVDGQIMGSVLSIPILPVTVFIDNNPATVLYAGSAPDLVAGILQVNVQLPPDLAAGQHLLSLLIGGISSGQTVYLYAN